MKRAKPKAALGLKPAPEKRSPKAGLPSRVLFRLPRDYPLKGNAIGLKLKLARTLDLLYN